MAYVYILEGLKDGRYYIGSALHLEKRIRHHKAGGTPTTRRFGGVNLVFAQEHRTLIEARRIEQKLKRLKRKDYLKKIIQDGYTKNP